MSTDTLNLTLPVSINRVQDLLCCALEGGSNYWYHIDQFIKPKKVTHPARYADDRVEKIFRHLEYPTNPGGALLIRDKEGGNIFRLDLECIEKGLKVMAEKYPRHFGNFISEDDDAETGDVFLQCTLFGELVYG